MLNLFLYGEDTIADVRQLREDAISAVIGGVVVKWTSENTSVEKSKDYPLETVIKEANYFLRLYDPQVRKKNPVIRRTIANLLSPNG
jgi:hypothetical protein